MPAPRQYIQSTQIIHYPADKLWALISSGTKVETWHSLVDSCTLMGTRRICLTQKGALEEDILVNDSENKTYKYLIKPQDVYPISTEIYCTIKIFEAKEGTVFTWDIEFDETTAELYTEMKEGFLLLSAASRNMINELRK